MISLIGAHRLLPFQKDDFGENRLFAARQSLSLSLSLSLSRYCRLWVTVDHHLRRRQKATTYLKWIIN